MKGLFPAVPRLLLCLLCLVLAAKAPAQNFAQQPLPPIPAPIKKKHADRDAKNQPSVPPAVEIPVTPLGYAPPAPFYIGNRYTQASLNFLDEDTLLFTFRVPGLIARQRPSGDQPAPNARNIRALVLSISTGKVTAEALWTLHDNGPYLWALNNQHFLLRDQNSIRLGDASLHLEGYLHFPGNVHFLQLDPAQRLLVADSIEAPEATAAPSPTEAPSTSSPQSATDNQYLLRIFQLETRKVLFLTHISGLAHLPIDGEGYYEPLRSKANNWVISYQSFRGTSSNIATVESSCTPSIDVLAHNLVLASACVSGGGRRLFAIPRGLDSVLPKDLASQQDAIASAAKDHPKDSEKAKKYQWETSIPATEVWPLLATAANGSRLVRATLSVAHPIGPTNPLQLEDLRGQSLHVYDSATGKVALSLTVTPPLDGGGNFALSPSGSRFAALNNGSIQVFELPPAQPLPALQP